MCVSPSVVIATSILIILVSGCSPQVSSTVLKTPDPNASKVDYCSSNLREKVEEFAIGEGDEEILKKLGSCRRIDLVARLDEIKNTARADDSIRVKIAFLLCRLEYGDDNDTSLIVTSLAKRTGFVDLGPDDVLQMIGVLIEHGNKPLISGVLEAVPWADGAVAEGISDILARELMEDPDYVVQELENRPPSLTRKAVFLIRSGLDETRRVKALTLLKGKTSLNHSAVAKQLIESLAN
jgi:hypothetical protein